MYLCFGNFDTIFRKCFAYFSPGSKSTKYTVLKICWEKQHTSHLQLFKIVTIIHWSKNYNGFCIFFAKFVGMANGKSGHCKITVTWYFMLTFFSLKCLYLP